MWSIHINSRKHYSNFVDRVTAISVDFSPVWSRIILCDGLVQSVSQLGRTDHTPTSINYHSNRSTWARAQEETFFLYHHHWNRGIAWTRCPIFLSHRRVGQLELIWHLDGYIVLWICYHCRCERIELHRLTIDEWLILFSARCSEWGVSCRRWLIELRMFTWWSKCWTELRPRVEFQ